MPRTFRAIFNVAGAASLIPRCGHDPVSRQFGFDRGTPIDRYYIEEFLEGHRSAIQGSTLEVAESTYSRRFGGDAVDRYGVLHVSAGAEHATIHGDLADPTTLPEGIADCFICMQTLNCVYDLASAVQSCFRLLRPGGVLLATVPGVCQVSRYDMDRWGDYWRFTGASVGQLFGDVFGPENVTVEAYGNVKTACALLYGLAAEELQRSDLDHRDRDYPVLLGVRASRIDGKA